MSTHRRTFAALAVAVVTLSGPVLTASAEEPAPQAVTDRPSPDQPDPVARGLIVKTTTSTPSDAALDATDDALGSEAEVTVDDKVAGKISTIDFDQEVPAEVAADVAAQIAKRSDVVWATPNVRRTIDSVPPVTKSDSLFTSQKNLWDSSYASPAGGYSIKAPSLWRATEGSSDVRVAVLDTGILDNDELEGQLVDGHDFVGPDDPDAPTPSYQSAADGDGWDSSPVDPGDWASRGLCYPNSPGSRSSWHGTFVAGQIAARADNGPGIVGVAPGVKVQPVRVLGRCGGWDSDIIAGILWASGETVPGVPDNATPSQVINLSLGYTYGSSAERVAACHAYESAASIARANGSVLIAAAGNDGSNADWAVPAACANVMSVGATSGKGFSALYSNIGKTVDLSAPGGDTFIEGAKDSIIGLSNTGTTSASDTNTYVRYEGASMAAPQVSAAAALFYSLGIETPERVSRALIDSVSIFRTRSTTYGNKKIRIGGHTYYVDLNCRGNSWCGAGILDLSKVQYPLGEASFAEDPIIGEPLQVVLPPYVSNGPLVYEWAGYGGLAGPGAPPWSNFHPDPRVSSYYTPSQESVGKQIKVRVYPGSTQSLNGYSSFSTTATSAPVPPGPTVQVTGTGQPKYGVDSVVKVYSPDVANGPIEIRRGNDTVMAVGTLEDHNATVEVPGLAWAGGSYPLRAAFLGDETTNPASSPGSWVAVSKANPTVTISLPAAVKRTSNAKLKVTIKVVGDPRPTGAIKVYVGRFKHIATSHMFASNGGTRTITLPKLKAGKHSIRIYYFGNDNITARYSVQKGIVSKK